MFILKNAHTDKKESFKTIYQISKYFYQIGITKNKDSQTGIKNALRKGTAIYKHYFVYEIPDAK